MTCFSVWLTSSSPTDRPSTFAPTTAPSLSRQHARVARRRRQDALHRARQPLGERLLREPELQAQRRATNGEIFTTLREAQVLIENYAITMLSARTRPLAIGHRLQKRPRRQHLVCPTLRCGQPRCWPTTAGF